MRIRDGLFRALLIGANLTMAALSYQPEVTVTLTPEQQAAVEAVVAFENANIEAYNARCQSQKDFRPTSVDGGSVIFDPSCDSAPRPLVTLQQIVQQRLDERLQGDITWHAQQQREQIATDYDRLTPEERDKVRAILDSARKRTGGKQ